MRRFDFGLVFLLTQRIARHVDDVVQSRTAVAVNCSKSSGSIPASASKGKPHEPR